MKTQSQQALRPVNDWVPEHLLRIAQDLRPMNLLDLVSRPDCREIDALRQAKGTVCADFAEDSEPLGRHIIRDGFDVFLFGVDHDSDGKRDLRLRPWRQVVLNLGSERQNAGFALPEELRKAANVQYDVSEVLFRLDVPPKH